MHLGDLGTPALTFRRLAVLLRNLPRNAVLLDAMDAPGQWGHVEWLLARMVYAAEAAVWQNSAGKGRRPKPPRPPGSPEPGKRRTIGEARSLDDMRSLLDRWKAGDIDAQEVN